MAKDEGSEDFRPEPSWTIEVPLATAQRLSLFFDDAIEAKALEEHLGQELAAVVSLGDLPYQSDYRGALQRWFGAVRVGGHLAITVPHALLHERKLMLPAEVDLRTCRLYTPATLLNEIEESLAPNSYRVRLLTDEDSGYDYPSAAIAAPGERISGNCEIILVLEKISGILPERGGARARGEPNYAFEPVRTRIEATSVRPHRRILILKLDHLGDFIMSIAAIERARLLFAEAHITLVVGAWNADLARTLNVADEIVVFDAFPRNSAEEEVDVVGKTASFRQTIDGRFDLAIDLRVDPDTRFLLKSVDAELRAGLGTRAQFPFLDIFLPIDFTRGDFEMAREDRFDHHVFQSREGVDRLPFRLELRADKGSSDGAMIWGPYRRLRPGRYLFDPFLEPGATCSGFSMDIALDAERKCGGRIEKRSVPRLEFTVDAGHPSFEFRIWKSGLARGSVSFFGGRLVREAASSVLHQSEYQSLLIQLVADRVKRTGILGDLIR